MKLALNIKTSLSQTLTPQQIQYLKLLQLPIVQLEQHILQEIEQNPMLDEFDDQEMENEIPSSPVNEDLNLFENESRIPIQATNTEDYGTDYYGDDYQDPVASIDDQSDPFEFYKMLWQDDTEFMPSGSGGSDDDDSEPFQIKDQSNFAQELFGQLSLYELSEEELIAADYIIGNIDDDGYLRRDMKDIVVETNSQIAEINFNAQQTQYLKQNQKPNIEHKNPALKYALNSESVELLEYAEKLKSDDFVFNLEKSKSQFRLNSSSVEIKILKHITLDTAEKILKIIQNLDPPGIGSRNIQECLVAQCKAFRNPSNEQKLALEILKNAFDAFIKKHYHLILRQYNITEDTLRNVIEEIKKLNPKPGGGDFHAELNTVIPDFVVEKEEETDELVISVNDSRMPMLKLNKAYEVLKKEAKAKQFNKDTKNWIRNKFEDAKFLIQAIRQRKNTMLKVMTAIAGMQKDFFDEGVTAIKPMIYKDVSDNTGLDISTVCRIVNGKYVQTEFGTFELKYFFSEALPNDDGEDISTTVIKQILKEMIESEPKDKPYSDDKLAAFLKEKKYNVARRTVAKYREQMKIPVARLRKEL